MSTAAGDVKSVFGRALEFADPADRAAFLDATCAGNAALRDEVDGLLAALDQAGGFLRSGPAAPGPRAGGPEAAAEAAAAATFGSAASVGETADRPGRDEHVGAVLAGRYKLVEAIGEGGMGAVFLAQQTEPVKRAVAVKVIKAGMDSKAVLARFEAERQALALMDHPNIARVLDAGTTESGRPFFVMELVKGMPITQFCDERRLTPRQRLELFVPVCQAIQHAHQKGVIHRDIKPSNVLVALYDDRPVPKVIDFGVAKAAGPTLTDKTLLTGFGAVVGTPEYMSPEQASLNNLDVDTRSDVYSLGVLLYELLTGSTPVDRKSLGQAALLEVLRVVREVEAPKPSARLSTLDTLPSVAANRGTEPAKLSKLMRGELDWLVLKALEKDRTRRYETANGLAADVQRYLSGEPVQAVPPTTAYRLRKFVRKNRGPVAAAGLVLIALLAGVVGTTFGLLRADEKRREAEQAGEREAEQRQRAEVEGQRAFDSLVLMTDLSAMKLIGSRPTLGPSEREYLEAALKLWQAYAATSGGGSRADYYRAQGLFRVSSLKGRLGRHEEAAAGLRQAATAWEEVVAAHPDTPAYRDDLASTYINLGASLSQLTRQREAAAAAETAVGILRELVAAQPDNPRFRGSLVGAYTDLGQHLAGVGEWERAGEALAAARRHLDAALAGAPPDRDWRTRSADLYDAAAILAGRRRSWPSAEDGFRKAIEVRKTLAADRPGDPEEVRGLATSQGNLGYVLDETGRKEASLAALQEAQRLRAQLVSRYPAVTSYRADLLDAHSSVASILAQLQRFPEAEMHFRAAFDLGERLAAERPDDPAVAAHLGRLYKGYAHFLMGWGYTARPLVQAKAEQSVPYFDRALAVFDPLFRRYPDDRQLRDDMFSAVRGKAEALHRLRRTAEALQAWDRAVPLAPPAEVAHTRSRRAMSLAHAGKAEEAVAEVEALRAERAAVSGWDEYDFACIYALATKAHPDKVDRHAAKAVELIRKQVQAGGVTLAEVESDADLDPIRDRDEFRKLLAELKIKFPPKREVLPPPRRE